MLALNAGSAVGIAFACKCRSCLFESHMGQNFSHDSMAFACADHSPCYLVGCISIFFLKDFKKGFIYQENSCFFC